MESEEILNILRSEIDLPIFIDDQNESMQGLFMNIFMNMFIILYIWSHWFCLVFLLEMSYLENGSLHTEMRWIIERVAVVDCMSLQKS